MFSFITFATIILQVHSGLITHSDDEHGKATSYQSVNIEHFHPVPTYAKKEYKHLLEHPIPIGQSTTNLEVHHGDKHDHGYAIVDSHSKFHVHDEHQAQDVSSNHQPQAEDVSTHHQHQPQAQYVYYSPKSLKQSGENLVYKSAGYPTYNSVHQEEEEPAGYQDQGDAQQDDEVKIYFNSHNSHNQEGEDKQDDNQKDHVYHQYYHNGYAHQQEHSSEQH